MLAVPLALVAGGLLSAACASTVTEPAPSTTDEAISGGHTDSHSTVTILGGGFPQNPHCSGTLLTPSWVLTSTTCVLGDRRGASVCTAIGCAGIDNELVNPRQPLTLLHLTTPLPMLGPPQQLASAPPGASDLVVLAGTGTGSPSEAYFRINGQNGLMFTAGQGSFLGATVTSADEGGGAYLFNESQLFGVVYAVVADTVYVEAFDDERWWIASNVGPEVVCGGATCGVRPINDVAISCGRCPSSETCDGMRCVTPQPPPPPPPPPPPTNPCKRPCPKGTLCNPETMACEIP